MGYATKRSAGTRVLATSAVVGILLLAFHLAQLAQLHDAIVRPGAKEEEQPEALAFGARLTPKELGYTDDIMESDLLRPHALFAQEAAAKDLQFQFMAHSFNHESALVINLFNANLEGSVSVELPAGMLLAPKNNRDLQNLVLRDAVNVELLPGESRRLEQWAFCGNQFHLPPLSEMKPSGWILDAPPCQGCVWRATAPYETAVPAAEGPWMAAKLNAALGA